MKDELGKTYISLLPSMFSDILLRSKVSAVVDLCKFLLYEVL
jgi:hypothetical protein